MLQVHQRCYKRRERVEKQCMIFELKSFYDLVMQGADTLALLSNCTDEPWKVVGLRKDCMDSPVRIRSFHVALSRIYFFA